MKASDSVSSYMHSEALPFERGLLSKNQKFSTNDVVMLTLQPRGSGDFFGAHTLPNNKLAVSIEARVSNTGTTYMRGVAAISKLSSLPLTVIQSDASDPKKEFN